jgi:hypothetical protein
LQAHPAFEPIAMYNSISEVKIALQNWHTQRAVSIAPAECHFALKIPFEIEYLRESLCYRFVELIEGAITLVEAKNFLGATIVARSMQETLAVLFYINELSQKALDNQSVQDLPKKLDQLMFGKGKPEAPLPDKINILTLIRKVDKKFQGFENHYDYLSEYSHPNWSGTMGIFAKTGGKEVKVDFGRYLRGLNAINTHLDVSITLYASLYEYAQEIYDEISPDIIALCDQLHSQSKLLPHIYLQLDSEE